MAKIIKNTTEDAKKVLEALKDNEFYCPCVPFRTDDTKCMCKEFREMEEGTCHCGLYTKVKE